jgi:hypothetical protein
MNLTTRRRRTQTCPRSPHLGVAGRVGESALPGDAEPVSKARRAGCSLEASTSAIRTTSARPALAGDAEPVAVAVAPELVLKERRRGEKDGSAG